jgi:trk system potassium uptake protein TrkH
MRVRVDWRTGVSFVGTVLKLLAVPLTAVSLVAVWYGEPPVPFLLTAVVSAAVGAGLERLDRGDIGLREAFLVVSLTWLAVALIGALPFVFLGTGVFASPVNALFESMSGVTTTGATVVVSFDAHGRALLLWRALLQWIGGLSILVLAVALLSQLSVGGAQLMETESQTRDVTKLTPRIAETARLIGTLYVALTISMVLVLVGLELAGLAPAMTVYDAVAHAFTAVSTAGFSPRAESLGAFSPAVQWVTIPYMILGATNFVLLYHAGQGDFARLRRSDEFRFYLGVLTGFTALVAAFLVVDGEFTSVERTLRHALFQTVSIVTTTGYATVDFDLWSPAAKHILFLGMFVGGMAGSTTCSIKTLRWLVVIRGLRRDLFTRVHPEAVRPVRLSGRVIDEAVVRDVFAYTLLSVVIFGLTTVFLVTDAARVGLRITEFEAMGAAAATFLNIGPAFGFAGPYGSYEPFSVSTKLAMTALMWIGRIEVIPVLVVLTPSFWTS